MLLFIENVQTGAEYDNKIYNYFISAKTNDGKAIEIFDYSCLNLIPYISSFVECQLFANLSPPSQDVLTVNGKYIGKRDLKNWKCVVEDRNREQEYNAIETSSGIIMFNDTTIENEYQEGATIQLYVSRFDLIAVNN